MRLIDADILDEEIKNLRVIVTGLRAGKGILNEYAKQYRQSLLRIIEEQPTAYDINKVVEELEKLADNSNDHMYESYFDGKEDGIRNAIEIVKQGGDTSNMVSYKNSVWNGGVSDDVCEWKYGNKNDLYPYMTSCGLYFEMDVDFVYCPGCGKKIKVVE